MAASTDLALKLRGSTDPVPLSSPPPNNPVSLLGHVEAARVNVLSFTHFNLTNNFHSQVKQLSFNQPNHAIKTEKIT